MSPTNFNWYPRVLDSDLVLAIVVHDLDAVLDLNDMHVSILPHMLSVVEFHYFW